MAETSLTGEITVNTSTSSDQLHAATVALAGGGFVIVWEDEASGDIYARLYDSSGTAAGGEFLVKSDPSIPYNTPSASALTGGGFVVAWQSGTGSNADIYARRFDSSGSAVGSDFLVNTTTSNEQLNPRVTGLSGGGFIVIWDTMVSGNFEDVRGQIYNSSGSTVGSQFVLNTTTTDQQGISAIAPLNGGGFVAVWQSVISGNVELIAQRFDSSGSKVGSEFQVNSTTTGLQEGVDVALMSDGSFVFSWTSIPGGGGGQVHARRYDSSGSALSGEITIQSVGSGNLGFTSVTALANGAFVVSWEETSGGADRIRARGYDSANSAITNVFDVSQTNSGDHSLTADGSATLTAGSVVFAWAGPGSSQDIVMRRFSLLSIDGTAGDNTLNGTTGDDVMNGLAGNDLLFAQQGGNDIVNGGNDNDGIYFGGAMTSADAADGGSGTDTLALQGVYTGLTLGSGVVGIEVLLVMPADFTTYGYSGGPTEYVITTVDANVASGATLTVQATELDSGEDLTFNGSAETNGVFRIFAGKGIDNLTGGAGSDGFFFGADGNLTGADVIAGGGSADSIALRGNYVSGTAVVFQNGSFSSIEVVVFLSGHTNEFGGVIDTNGFDYDVTFANGNIPSGVRLDVIASNLRSNESARVDASAELDGSVRILSGAGDDILIGSANADFLYGGLGADTINGGGGADTYSYRATGESTSASRDTVMFVTGDIFDMSIIDANSSTPGTNDTFTFIGSSAFSNTAGQLRAFSSGTGQWTIEADVNGDSSADLVILVNTSNSLGSGDFIL